MLHFQFRQIYDFKNIFFCYRTMILLKLKATRYKKKCNGCIYWIAFAPHPRLFEFKFNIYEIIMPVHFKEEVDEEIKPLGVVTGRTLT